MGTGDDAVVTDRTPEAPGREQPASGFGSGAGRSPGDGGGPAGARRAAMGAARGQAAGVPRGHGAGAGRVVAIGAVVAAAGALLFLAYLRVSWTVVATSDGAAQALQARDMLAGNWLLHGWTLSDVSFYTTELPEYVAVELIRPFGLGVIHVAAALTYTLLALAVVALARGRATGREGVVRGLLAGVIMLAPQLGYGAFVLLLSPDHVGTQVPLLACWLLLDLGPRRWWVPALLCLLLALVQVADRIALLTAVLPLIVVCAATAARQGANCAIGLTLAGPEAHSARQRRPRAGAREAGAREAGAREAGAREAGAREAGARWVRAGTGEAGARWVRAGTGEAGARWVRAGAGEAGGRWVRDGWFEVAAAGAAVGSVGLAWAAARGLAAAGGFTGHPFPLTPAPLSQLWTHAWLTGWGILELYGANFVGVSGPAGLAFAAVHLIGLALAAAAVAVSLWRFIQPTRPIPPRPQGRAPVFGLRREGAQRLTDEGEETGFRRPEANGEALLAVAVVANLVSYLVSTAPGTVLGTGYDAREIAAVLPLGAVLAGRVFGPALAGVAFARDRGLVGSRNQWTGRAGATDRSKSCILVCFISFVAIAGYASALGYSAAQAGRPGQESGLAGWLVAHGLRYGLGQSSANVVTVDSGARAELMPVAVRDGRVRPLLYQAAAAAYDPRLHDADFLVSRVPPAQAGEPVETVPYAAVRATFGPPARSYRFAGYTVLVWDVNLLTRMAR